MLSCRFSASMTNAYRKTMTDNSSSKTRNSFRFLILVILNSTIDSLSMNKGPLELKIVCSCSTLTSIKEIQSAFQSKTELI